MASLPPLNQNLITPSIVDAPFENPGEEVVSPSSLDFSKEDKEDEEDEQFNEIAPIILQLVKDLTEKEKDFRRDKLAIWRRNELMWRGFQRLINMSDDLTPDYRPLSSLGSQDLEDFELDPGSMNGIVNIIRAYGESIIGALAVELPEVRFFPKDADNQADVITSKTFSKVSELLAKQNDSPILFLKALYTLFNEDFVACYSHYYESKEFGEYEEVVTREESQKQMIEMCQSCGGHMTDVLPAPDGTKCCEICGESGYPEQVEHEYENVVFDHVDHHCKGRVILEIYGPSNVMIPLACKNQKATPYLVLDTEAHISAVKSMYGKAADKVVANTDVWNQDTWARLPPEYAGQSVDYVTVRKAWIRPWAFSLIPDEGNREKIKTLYPLGVLAHIINDEIFQIEEDELDKHWQISVNPLSKFLHAEPPANAIIPIQEMYTDLNDLTMETIRQGISETFVDVEAIDLANYSKQEAHPGDVYPAKARSGMPLGNSFFEMKTANLSKEVSFFMEKLEQMGQFVLGAFPSIYGGPQPGGKTAREYELSRSQALQRLSILWKMLNSWWPHVMVKACRLFQTYLKWDENHVKQNGTSFTNVWIRQMDMLGAIADVEPEISEQFPVSWAEQRDATMTLIQMNNEAINGAIFSPDNMEYMSKIIGLRDLRIPGNLDREKQLKDIAELLKSGPLPDGSPTVPPDMMLDDQQVCIATIRTWAISETGLDSKETNPDGYANVMAQYMMRATYVQQQAKMAAASQPQVDKNGKPIESNPGSQEPPPAGDMAVELPEGVS